MSSRPAKQPSNERRLFADICGALASLGAALGALIVPEAVEGGIVPLGWSGYFILWVAVWIAIVAVVAKWFRSAYGRYLELADAHLPTPSLLQRGYGWIVGGLQAKLKDPSPFQMALFGVSIGVSMSLVLAVLKWSGVDWAGVQRALEAAGPFLAIVLILFVVNAICIAIFLLASLLAGLVVGKPKANSDSS